MSEKKFHSPNKKHKFGGPPGAGIGKPVEKAKDFKGTLKRLLQFLRPQFPKIAVVMVFAVLSTVFTVMGPKIMGVATNQLTDGFIAKSMVKGINTAQDKMIPILNDKLGKINDAYKLANEKANQQVEQKFNEEINKQKNAAYQMAAQKADAAAIKIFNETIESKKQQAYNAATEKADAVAKQKVDESFRKMFPTLTDFSGLDVYKKALASAKTQAEKAAGQMVDAEFQKQQSKMQEGLESAKKQAEAKAKQMVDAEFAKRKPTLDQKLNEARSKASAAARDMVTKQILKQGGLTQEQLDTLKRLAALPKISTITDNNKKADTVKEFISLVKKLPKSMMPNGSSTDISALKQASVDKAIKNIRETGGKIPFDQIGKTLEKLLLIYVLSSLATFLMQYIMSGVAQNTVYDMRQKVDKKIARLPLKYFDSHSNGDMLSRMTNDVDTISTTLQQSLTQLITSIMQMIGYIWMMLTISPILTLIVMATLPLYIIATMFIAKKSQIYYTKQQKHLGSLSGHTEEMFTGHVIVKAFGHEKESIKTFKSVNEDLYKVGWKAQFMSGIMMPIMNFISNIGYVMIAVIGGIFVTKSYLNLGDITAFISYSKSFSMPIIQTANIANVIQSTVACAERVFELLDEEEEVPDGDKSLTISNPQGNIRFSHVDFSYKEEAPLIKDMNLDIKKGDVIAIVGPTGAGKTTLVNLLMRFYEIQGGSITFDNVDIRNIRRGELRKMFGMVLQDTWLFNGTIKENIAYGHENATDDEIRSAAKAAHADHFIRSLPDGYSTVLNEEASNISQGQKQLLTIARAILADPSVLILDEATSSVDTRTEVRIQKAMEELMKGRTNFVIAHRLSTIRDAKTILVMKHGTIIEKGNHKELIEKHGFYYDLYNSQFLGNTAEG